MPKTRNLKTFILSVLAAVVGSLVGNALRGGLNDVAFTVVTAAGGVSVLWLIWAIDRGQRQRLNRRAAAKKSPREP